VAKGELRVIIDKKFALADRPKRTPTSSNAALSTRGHAPHG